MTQRNIDLSEVSSLPSPGYTAHFVPCKVRYSGPTEEFARNFQLDSDNHQSLRKNEAETESKTSHVTYLRGRKIIGQEFFTPEEYNAFLMKRSSDASDASTLKPVAKISNLINYERDGNEERLNEELSKFNEFIKLVDIIHS